MTSYAWFALAYFGANGPFQPSITMKLRLSLTASVKRSHVDTGHFQFPAVSPSRSTLCLRRCGRQTQSFQPSWSCRLQPGEELPVVLFCCQTNRLQHAVCVWVQARQVRTLTADSSCLCGFTGEENDHKKRQCNLGILSILAGWWIYACA